MTLGERLAEAIAAAWPELRELVDDADFERRMLVLLRAIEADPADATATQHLVALFETSLPLRERLRQAVSDLGAQKGGGGQEPDVPAGARKMQRYTAVPVLYGTNRAALPTGVEATWYGGERGDIGYGIAEVSVPDDHRMGKLEAPSGWRVLFGADPTRDVVVLSVTPLTAADFVTRGRELLGPARRQEILLFVHGYHVSFSDALRRTAQFAYDLHFEGVAALYSWPSEAKFVAYTIDEGNARWAAPHFSSFLRMLRTDFGADCVNVVAHSMGNLLLVDALAAEPVGKTDQAALQQIVLTAPDLDAATFREAAAKFGGKASRITLYASSRDRALLASKGVHKYPRAGESGPTIVLVETCDTVDAAAVDTSFVGHSYFADNRSVLSDLFYLIREGLPPAQRAGLRAREKSGRRYWLFSP